MTYKYDFLVIGSGIAGMSFALKVADKGKVALICKTDLEEANTYLAQGGVASVTNTLVDNFEKHIEDTLIAGDGHCDRKAVHIKHSVTTGAKYSVYDHLVHRAAYHIKCENNKHLLKIYRCLRCQLYKMKYNRRRYRHEYSHYNSTYDRQLEQAFSIYLSTDKMSCAELIAYHYTCRA